MPKHVVDLLILNDGDLIGFVQAKRWRDPTPEAAEELMPHLVEYESLDDLLVPYAMLFTPTTGYLWKDPSRLSRQRFEFDTTAILARYIPDAEERNRLFDYELSLVALEWLNNLASKENPTLGEAEQVLEQAGFLKAIKDAAIYISVPLYAAAIR